MANNEQISQDVKVEESQPVSAENETAEDRTAKTEINTTNIVTNNVVVNINSKKKKDKVKKQKKAKDKKPNTIAKRLKETSSELKKVTWPKFTTVLKQTGVVLLVTALFLLVVFGIDRLCSWLVGFIV